MGELGMKRTLLSVFLFLALLACTFGASAAVAQEPPAAQAQSGYSFRADYDAIEQKAKSLFYVEVYDENLNFTGNASGFVSFDEHLFVTNQHVIDGARYLKIWDDDQYIYFLDRVAASDREMDIALLIFPDGKQYESLEQGTDPLKRGQPIVTIGSPEGYQGTVAEGIISAFPPMEGNEDRKYIQISAPISPGSSGGALFDDRGRVIGVTTSTLEAGQNLNFCIPIQAVRELYDKWDKSSYQLLGTQEAWNMAGSGVPGRITVTVNGTERTGTYSGEERNGIPDGSGVFESDDGLPELIYEGTWKDGTARGEGTLHDAGYRLTAETREGRFDVEGTYDGEVYDGVAAGEGTFASVNSENIAWSYTGHFAGGTFDGYGSTSWENGAYEEGNYVNGQYTPTWTQVVVSMCKWDGYEINKSSVAFMKSYESLFTSDREIEPYLVYKAWDPESFREAPERQCSKLAVRKNLTVLHVGEPMDMGMELTYLALSEGDTIYYGFVHDSSGLEEDAVLSEAWFLPLNMVTFTDDDDGSSYEVVLCCFTGHREAGSRPAQGNSLALTAGYTVALGRQLLVNFDLENAPDGAVIRKAELCAYAADKDGAVLFGGQKFYVSTYNPIGPGGRTRSPQIRFPEREGIATVYCGISKIEYEDGTVLDIGDVVFEGYTVK